MRSALFWPIARRTRAYAPTAPGPFMRSTVPAQSRDKSAAGPTAAPAPPLQMAVTMPDNHAVSRYRNHARSMQRMAAPRIKKAGGVAF